MDLSFISRRYCEMWQYPCVVFKIYVFNYYMWFFLCIKLIYVYCQYHTWIL